MSLPIVLSTAQSAYNNNDHEQSRATDHLWSASVCLSSRGSQSASRERHGRGVCVRASAHVCSLPADARRQEASRLLTDRGEAEGPLSAAI